MEEVEEEGHKRGENEGGRERERREGKEKRGEERGGGEYYPEFFAQAADHIKLSFPLLRTEVDGISCRPVTREQITKNSKFIFWIFFLFSYYN